MTGTTPPPAIPPANVVPTGYIDIATAQKIEGWALDPDSKAQPVLVSLYVGAMKDAGGVKLGEIVTAKNRPDVNMVMAATGLHGFEIPVAANADLGGKTVFLYAKDIQTGVESYIGTKIATAAPADPVVPFTCAANQQPSISGMNSTQGDGNIRFNLAMPACNQPSKGTYELSIDNGTWMSSGAITAGLLPQSLTINKAVCNKASCQVKVRMVHINPSTGVEVLQIELPGTYTVTRTSPPPAVPFACAANQQPDAIFENPTAGDGSLRFLLVMKACNQPSKGTFELRADGGAWIPGNATSADVLPASTSMTVNQIICNKASCTVDVRMVHVHPTNASRLLAIPMKTYTVTKTGTPPPPTPVTCRTDNLTSSYVAQTDGRASLFITASQCSSPAELEVEVRMGTGAWVKAGTFTLPTSNQIVPLEQYCALATCSATARVNFKALGAATIYQTFAIPGSVTITKPPAAVTCPTASVAATYANLLDGRGNLFLSANNCSVPAELEVEVQLGTGTWTKAGTFPLPIMNKQIPMGVTCTKASCPVVSRVKFKALGSSTIYQTFDIPLAMNLTTAQCTYSVTGGPVVQPGASVYENIVCGQLPAGGVARIVGTHKAPGSNNFVPQIDAALALVDGKFTSKTDNIDYKIAGIYSRHIEVRAADGLLVSRFPVAGELTVEVKSALQCPLSIEGGNPLASGSTLTIRLAECSYPPSGAKVYIMVNKNGAKLDLFPDPIVQYELGFFEKSYLNTNPDLQGDYEFWVEVRDQSGAVILSTPKILRKVLPGFDLP